MSKKWMVIWMLVVWCCAVSSSHADTYTRGKSDHPLRYVAYAFYPVGVAVEYLALRPFHKFVSRDPQAAIFGHQPQAHDEFPGWAGRRRYDDSRARTPLYTFLTREPAEDPLKMMQEEMEAEAAEAEAIEAIESSPATPRQAPEEIEVEVDVEAQPESGPVSDRSRPGRIKVEIAESA